MAGEKENPFTREDVLRLIEENGGTAEGLDLSGKVFEKGIDLQGLNLEGIILRDAQFPVHFEGEKLVGAKFDGADLTGADLHNANLQYAQFKMLNSKPTLLSNANFCGSLLLEACFQGADLTAAKFGGVAEAIRHGVASLDSTDFRGANLFLTNFEGCYFYRTKLEGACIRGTDIYDAHLEEADWGSYVIGEENKKDFYSAQGTYRRLKMWYTNAGVYDIAAKFYYREMEAKRKAQSWKSEPISKLWLWVIKLLCGYGEKPWRVVVWGISVLFGSALLYFFLRGVAPHTLTLQAFLASLYYSAVSFTALGYGPWFNASSVRSWAQGVGAAEAIIGVFTIALFLVTFVKKMTR